jgi:hypothetical protein
LNLAEYSETALVVICFPQLIIVFEGEHGNAGIISAGAVQVQQRIRLVGYRRNRVAKI